jgi:hypothetical protein
MEEPYEIEVHLVGELVEKMLLVRCSIVGV